jgi:catechol 2,3-dioxygenase-like lactoylglutathione lyase family enzyme
MLGKYALMAFVATAEPVKGRAFYEEKLGLTARSVDDYGVMYDAGGTTLRMSFVRELHPAPYSILSWMVTDIHSVIAALKKKGVVFEVYEGMGQDEAGVWSAPGGTKVAWFKDPGGNLLSLSEIS